MIKLIVSLEHKIIEAIDLKDDAILRIGRHSSNDLIINNYTVSNHHAHLFIIDRRCYLKDLQSTNGTWINYKKIKQCLLKSGDVITIAKYHLKYINLEHNVQQNPLPLTKKTTPSVNQHFVKRSNKIG